MSDIHVPKEIAQAVFDIAVNSMDFGSGFLDSEEVEHLRSFAVLIGVDPIHATPSGFRQQYPHAFEERFSEWGWNEEREWDRLSKPEATDSCVWCGARKETPWHRPQDE